MISTLDKVIYYKGTFLQRLVHRSEANVLFRHLFCFYEPASGLNKTSPYKIGWRPAEKITFFQHASSKISMVGAIMESFCENTF
jgi:hypothetical protein